MSAEEVSPKSLPSRYAGVAIAFHWVIATLILANFPIAWIMSGENIDKSLSFALFQLHKSLGIAVLLLSIGRLSWRLMNPPPALPEAMQTWERWLSHSVHVLFYVFMIGVPLLGWMMVSASPTGIPTLLFGFIHWPHIAPLAGLTAAAKIDAHEFLEKGHELAAWGILGLLAMHVGGALKHQILDKQNLLARIAPGLFGETSGPEGKPKGALLAAGLVIVLLGAGAAAGLTKPPAAKTAAQTTPVAPMSKDSWVVNFSASSIVFSGEHGEKDFRGRFEDWAAEIEFAPDNLSAAKAKITIETASAKTGDAYYDSTLPQSDWFDAVNAPKAIFTTTAIRALGNQKYEADGALTLHGVTKPIVLPFTLKIDGDKAEMEAETKIKRLDYGIGAASDPKADWVSNDIELKIELHAVKPDFAKN